MEEKMKEKKKRLFQASEGRAYKDKKQHFRELCKLV